VFVSGTTARPPHLDGDAYMQMTGAIATVAAALGEAGAELRHVVRTVVYILDMTDAHHVARAHLETFGESRPASTLVQVAALAPASALVEIEVTAIVNDWFRTRNALKVAFGSNWEELSVSKCLPGYPWKQTLLNTVGMFQRVPNSEIAKSHLASASAAHPN
jgi:enamine deaminase RidA (YjgF/YER057c/UK114 family)